MVNAREGPTSQSQEGLTQEKVPNLKGFQNTLPPDEKNIKRTSLIRQPDDHFHVGRDRDLYDWKNRNLFKTVLVPTATICLPMALLSAALLTIVYLYKVDIRASLFAPTLSRQGGPPHVLVNFSASEYNANSRCKAAQC